MRKIMVRYKVKPDQVAENERFIAAVFERLARDRPEGLRYASLRLDDGVSFVHLVEMQPGAPALGDLAEFKAFTAQIRDRCDEPPVASDLSVIGAYRLFD